MLKNHEELWAKAIPDPEAIPTKLGRPSTWYCIDDDGIIHQFQVDHQDSVHWAGSESGERGLVIPASVKKRLKEFYNRKIKKGNG